MSQYWPIADTGDSKETDLFLVQPFVNYNFGKGYALSTAPLITANWNAPSGQQWTVPLGMGAFPGRRFNRRPMMLGVQYYYNVKRPDGTPGQTLRFSVSLLYPTAKR
jgi:hypothetical protein